MAEYRDTERSFYPYHRITDSSSGNYVWRHGHVVTLHATVLVDVSIYNNRSSTRLELVHNGRWHERRFEVAYSDRFVITLAKRFAQDVAEGVEDE